MNKRLIHLDDYDIVVDGSLESLNEFYANHDYSSMVVIVDEETERHCLPYFKQEVKLADRFHVISIPSGEEFKNLETCKEIWRRMLELSIDREGLVINLGGGVVGDMGGFAAACYKRGIDFLNIPTTVLSQVDASVGGKLGVDFEYGKNLIGMFRNPVLVIVNPLFHQTLSDRQYVNGFAEIFKHALISDRQEWQYLIAIENLRQCDVNSVLYNALKIKHHIVETDPYEKGIRKHLNFGHTIGHAVEAWSLQQQGHEHLFHGEAVIIGMICESYLSIRHCGLGEGELLEICRGLMKFYEYRPLPEEADQGVLEYVKYDKKNIGEHVMAVLLNEIGRPEINRRLSREDILDSLKFYRERSWEA